MNTNHSPQLVILEHPVDKFRFRYKSEMHGTHGSLAGSRSLKPNKTYPEVELKNFNKSGIIRCSLYQTNTTKPSLHSHLLVVHKEDKDVSDPHDVCVSQELGYIGRFENMGIVHTAKKDVAKELLKKKLQKLKFDSQCDELSMKKVKSLRDEVDREAKLMNLNQVCLCFEAFEIINNEGQYKKICEPVYSNPINNLKSALTGELKICRLSIYTGSVEGNDDLILLVEKVSKNNIKVRFFELSNDEEIWEAYGSFTEADVHHQYAIVVRTPPYRDKEIDNHVNVFIELVRDSDNKRSTPVPFRYKPKKIVLSRKRRRIPNSSSLNSPSPGSSFEMTDSMPQQIQQMKLEARANSMSEESSSGVYESSESNEYMCQFNTFMQQVDDDSDELKSLLQEAFFCDTDFGMWDHGLQLDGEDTIGRRKKQLSFHPALKLLITTFNDCPKIGFEYTIKRIQMICNSYAAQHDNANTIVHDVCKKSNQQEAAIVFKILSKLNLTNLLHQVNNDRQTALHVACMLDRPVYIRPLIGFKCDPNVQDINGNTALHIAVIDNCLQCAEALASNITFSKLNANLTNNEGMTPLHLAIRKNNNEFVKILLVKCNASAKLANSRDGNNALHLAVQQQSSEIIKIILESSDPSNLNITNRAGHTAVDLAKTLKNPKREEILNIVRMFVPLASNIDDEPDFDKSSNSSAEDDDMLLIMKIPDEDEARIRKQIQKDAILCKILGKMLTMDEKWKKFAKLLKLDHLICIWSDVEAMLRYVLDVESIKLLNVVDVLQVIDKEAANVMSSYIMKNLSHV